MLALLTNKKLEAFYFGDMPRILFWIGAVITAFHLLIFSVNWFYGGQPNIGLLLPHRSGFMLGVIALILSSSIPRNGYLTFLISLTGPIMAIFFYQRMEKSFEGITPKLPLEMTNLAVSTAFFFGAIFFIILTFRYNKENKFSA